MRISFILPIAIASIAVPAQADPISAGQLKLAVQGIVEFKAKDSFDALPAADLSGRLFVIEVPVAEFAFDTFKCKPNWSYNKNDGTLKVTIVQGLASTYMMARGPGASLSGAENMAYYFRPFDCAVAPVVKSQGVNGFGARVEIEHRQTVVLGFSKDHAPQPFVWTRNVAGDEGRALTQALRVRLSGTIGSWGEGGSIGCVREHYDPTFRSPVDDNTTHCVVKVTNLRTDLVDSRTGEVLATELPGRAVPAKGAKRR